MVDTTEVVSMVMLLAIVIRIATVMAMPMRVIDMATTDLIMATVTAIAIDTDMATTGK